MSKYIYQHMRDRIFSIHVSTDSSPLPDLPVYVTTRTEYVEESGLSNDCTQIALSIENARALQHALLTAINEAEQHGPGGAA